VDLLRNFNYRISREILPSFGALAYILSSWFRDYLYIPLGGSKGSKMKQVQCIYYFVVSGFGMVLIGLIWLGVH
jgi:D-alanyl-lipoteichoic acid acyltransferase DltB (MBOAT superfamily)